METKELIKLIETLNSMGYGHIDITHEGTHVMLDTKSLADAGVQAIVAPQQPVAHQVAPVATSMDTSITTPIVEDDNYITIDSPIVGTFYEAASPEADPFVKVGDKVVKGDVVCIIEAMKLMNEIEAEVAGEVVEILASNEGPVEYGQALYKLKPL